MFQPGGLARQLFTPSKDDWLSGRLPPGTALQWNGCFRSHPLVHCITPGMVRPGALSPRRNARQQCRAAYWCRLIVASPPVRDQGWLGSTLSRSGKDPRVSGRSCGTPPLGTRLTHQPASCGLPWQFRLVRPSTVEALGSAGPLIGVGSPQPASRVSPLGLVRPGILQGCRAVYVKV